MEAEADEDSLKRQPQLEDVEDDKVGLFLKQL